MGGVSRALGGSRHWAGCAIAGAVALLLSGTALLAQPAEVTVAPPSVTVGELWLLDSDPLRDSLFVGVTVLVSRDQPGGEPRNIPFQFDVRLVDPGGVLVGSVLGTTTAVVPPVVDDLPVGMDLWITPDSILSEDIEHMLRILVSHDDDPPSGQFIVDHAVADGPHTIVHFNGELAFGDVLTTMTKFSAAPEPLPGPNAWRLFIEEGELSSGMPYAGGPPASPHVEVVRNDSDGSAMVTAGSVIITPEDNTFSINGWTGALGRVFLDANGLEAVSFILDLPEGTGWRLDHNDPELPRTLNPRFLSDGVPLVVDEDLQPIEPASGTFAIPHEYVDERLAVGFVGANWTWDLQTLRLDQPGIRFLRQWHYDQWKSVKGELPDTNDGYLDQLAQTALNHLHIGPGMAGGFTVQLGLSPGEFSTHFPHGFIMHGAGILNLVNSVPDSGSQLIAATTAIITHTGCRGSDPHELPDPATREAVVVGPGTIRFTAQGSLWTEGVPLDAPPIGGVPVVRRAAAGLDPSSGLPIHETADYVGEDVQILIPGANVPAAGGVPGGFNPARWLYTGLRANDNDTLEHPGTPAYMVGAADYAGVNFRHFGGLTGISRIGGGTMGPYLLDPCQKLYARASGLTGRWTADETTLPPSIQVGGPDPFTLTLDSWAFQLLGNEPQFEYSAVAGSVELPYPADFILAFDSLEFTCCGNLDKVALAEGESVKSLAYWRHAHIAIQSARFVSADECSMEDSCLELHVMARANGFPEDLAGILLFRGSGRMTTGLDDPHPASGLHVESGSSFMGDYYITPVRHLYYNDPGPIDPSDPGDGFISVAGHLQLPFFEAMAAHGILEGTDLPPEVDPNIIHGLRRGWEDNGKTFFNNADFDAAHQGLPDEFVSFLQYTGTLEEEYLPRARRNWFGKVTFSFPVVYDTQTFHFHSPNKKKINVIIAHAEAEVPQLNHEKAKIKFGVKLGLSLNKLFSTALQFATGHIAEGYANLVIGDALEEIQKGLHDLDQMLALEVRNALGEAVGPELDGVISQAAEQLKGGASVQLALGQINLDAVLQEKLASTTAAFVAGKLGPIAQGLEGMRKFLEPGNAGQVAEFMEQSLGFLNLPPGLDSLSANDLIILTELADDGGALRKRMEKLRKRMKELKDLVENVTGLEQEIYNLLTGANAEFSNVQQAVRNALEDYFEMVHADPAAYTEAEVESRIRMEIEDRVWGMLAANQVQNVLRFRFYHLDHKVKQVLSSALELLNRTLADLIAEAVDLDGIVGDLTGFGGYVQPFSLKGEAIITGNDLTYLSLKAKTTLQIEPVPIDIHPFYEYHQLHSDGPTGCDPTAEPVLFNRITMGAKVAPARAGFADVSVTVSTQFSFAQDGRPIAFAGGFEFLGEGLGMQPVNFDRISALINIGGTNFQTFEFYMAAEGQATAFASGSPVQLPFSNFKLHGGIFLGRTCTDAPYAAWAPEHVTGKISPPFFGAIASVDGKLPFFDVGCMLRLKAEASIGSWGVTQGNSINLGAFTAGEVSGRFLCLISGKASLLMTGDVILPLNDEESNNPGGATLKGAINANLTAGPCPVCLNLNAGLAVELSTENGLSIDF